MHIASYLFLLQLALEKLHLLVLVLYRPLLSYQKRHERTALLLISPAWRQSAQVLLMLVSSHLFASARLPFPRRTTAPIEAILLSY